MANLLTRVKVSGSYSMKEFAPIVSNIIQQGVDKKEFDCNDPVLTAEFILIFMDVWMDPVIFQWTKDEIDARFGYLVAILNHMAPGMVTMEELKIMKHCQVISHTPSGGRVVRIMSNSLSIASLLSS